MPIPVISLAQRAIFNLGYTVKSDDDEKKMMFAARAILELAGLIGGVPGTSQVEQIVNDIFR